MSGFDLAVAYRVYPGISREPFIHPNDKFALTELCLRSFVQSLGVTRAKVWVILDGCPSIYEDLFRCELSNLAYELVKTDSIGNLATFQVQLKILSQQSDSSTVYLAEDDYLYQPGGLASMVKLLQESSFADFVSPYDHQDYYSRINLHSHPVHVESSHGRHWRESVYTCCTFMTRLRTLHLTMPVLQTYCRGNTDISLWMALTKYNVRSPYRLLKYLIRDREFLFPSLWRSYQYAIREVLFGKRWTLFTPLPSIATHVERKFLAPNVDWTKIASEIGSSAQR